MAFNERSMQRLKGVHPQLVSVLVTAAEYFGEDMQVSQGLRTIQQQRALVAKGASRTMKSRHLTGHAIDVVHIVNNKAMWKLEVYRAFWKVVEKVAKQHGIEVEWGGNWKSFVDGPHFQLSRRKYPAGATAETPYVARAADLRQGSKGEAVRKIQRILSITDDGIFGPGTHEAVKSWQQDRGLYPDGIVGPMTKKAMGL